MTTTFPAMLALDDLGGEKCMTRKLAKPTLVTVDRPAGPTLQQKWPKAACALLRNSLLFDIRNSFASLSGDEHVKHLGKVTWVSPFNKAACPRPGLSDASTVWSYLATRAESCRRAALREEADRPTQTAASMRHCRLADRAPASLGRTIRGSAIQL